MAAANGNATSGVGAAGARVFNHTFSSLPTTVFEEMSLLAAKHQSTNLGQGFPDNELEGPESMKKVVARWVPPGAVAVAAAAGCGWQGGCCAAAALHAVRPVIEGKSACRLMVGSGGSSAR